MRSALRATAILGSSSFVSILVGLASAKCWAIFLGPGGVGYMALLQSLMTLSVMVAGMGVGTGVVRSGAQAVAQSDLAGFRTLYRSAAWLTLSLSVLGAVALLAFRTPLSAWWLGGQGSAGDLLLLALALPFGLFAALQTAAINARHLVGMLAATAIANSLIGGAVSIFLVWLWRAGGVAPAVLAASVTSFAVSLWFSKRMPKGQLAVRHAPLTRAQFAAAARPILRFGAPYAAGMLVGAGAQMALPALALHALGLQSAGFYRVAFELSAGYLSILLAAMAQDYYPRVAAAKDQPDVLAQLINQQYRLVMLLAVPVVLAVLALAPHVISLIYSRSFTPAAEILEWQVIGDLFKFTSWSMSYVILARLGGATYLFTEAVFGAVILAASWWGMRWLGLAGLGVGFLVAYVVYYGLTWAVLRRDIGLRLVAANRLMLAGAVLAAVAIKSLPLASLRAYKFPLALAAALLAGAFSLRALWAEYRGGEDSAEALT